MADRDPQPSPRPSRPSRTSGPSRTSHAARTSAPAAWRSRPRQVRPTVLILGGFLTLPPLYGGLARRLLARGAAGVVVARVWTPDWVLLAARGPLAIATRSGRALLQAGRLAAEVSEGAPVLVVGHSAGGLIARLLTAPEPVRGQRFAAAGRIGAIVTLGTPHALANGQGIGRRLRDSLAAVADEVAPGTLHSPRIGYVSVASRAVRGDPAGTVIERVAHLLYRSVMGRAAAPGTEGDGLVPMATALLPGSRTVVLERAAHGPTGGTTWYGSEEMLDAWWPEALAAWHDALAIRAGSDAAAGPSKPPSEAPARRSRRTPGV